MTLQQLRYVDAIAKYGSVSRASRKLFISQPALTLAIQELEQEIGRLLFVRSSHGMDLTETGQDFLGCARQIMQQVSMLEGRYRDEDSRRYFSVSTQHNAFAASAFADMVRMHGGEGYEFSLLEERTSKVIENVQNLKSEIRILYLSRCNEAVIRKLLQDSDLRFSPLVRAKPRVFLFRGHPLAGKPLILPSELEEFPRVTFDQGDENSFYFSEEVFSERPSQKQIRVTDRAAAVEFLMSLSAYIIAAGVPQSYLHGEDIVSRPLEAEEAITVGIIRRADRITSKLGETFLAALEKIAGQIGTELHPQK